MNKMLWMSRQLRNHNDNVSISNWAKTMTVLKSLLLTSTSSLHQTEPMPSAQLTLSTALGCTWTILPSSPPLPTRNCTPSTLSKATHTSSDVGSKITEIKQQSIPQHVAVKRKEVYPQSMKHLPLSRISLI